MLDSQVCNESRKVMNALVRLFTPKTMQAIPDSPELVQGSRLKATGTAYVSTRACEELTTALASVDSRTEGAPLAASKARVAQLTW